MSIFSHYENDIFINYSHADNDDPKDDKDRGWVDALGEKLGRRLRQLTGHVPTIWHDRVNMRGHGVVKETLGFEVQNAALLVPVLSPSYITSDWCKRELAEFYSRAVAEGRNRINNKSRIFKVIKLPVKKDEDPEELRDIPGYQFYEEYFNGMPREFSHISGKENFDKFTLHLELLAWDIRCFVELCQSSDPFPRTVYLAETIADLKAERDEIKAELESHKYHVLPDKPLPTDGPNFITAVRDNLKKSRLSIHLIGEKAGFIPAGQKRDAVYLQHAFALERQSSSDFFRILWTPSGLQPHEPAQQRFISSLRTRSRYQKDAELLLGNTRLASLKTYVVGKLKSMTPPSPPAAPPPVDDVVTNDGQAEAVRIYLIFDKKDLESVRPLRNYLGSKYKVTWPVMEGVKQNIKDHVRNLSECDVAIIFYGCSKERWVREKLVDVEKRIVSRKPRPLSMLYITGPLSEAKEFYESSVDYQVIKNPGEFSEESLRPLLNEIQKRTKSEGGPRCSAKS